MEYWPHSSRPSIRLITYEEENRRHAACRPECNEGSHKSGEISHAIDELGASSTKPVLSEREGLGMTTD
jgi:hypothetical protein